MIMASRRARLLRRKRIRLLKLAITYLQHKRHTAPKRRYWVHPVNLKRNSEGAWVTFMRQCRENYPEKYKEALRMNSGCFDEVLLHVRHAIEKQDTRFRKAISPEQRLCLTLFYLASGDTFKTLAILFRLGQSTVRSIIFDTCKAIWDCMKDKFLKTPSTEDEWAAVADNFWKTWNFPNCLGALDGKHCAIQCPPKTGSEYFNYKKFFSIVLLGVCDSSYRFLYVDVGTSGRWSDGGTFDNCSLNREVETDSLHIPPPHNLPGKWSQQLDYLLCHFTIQIQCESVLVVCFKTT